MKKWNEFAINRWSCFGVLQLILCLIMVCFFDTNKHPEQNNYIFFATISIIELLLFYFYNTKLNNRVINFSFLFATCLYLFNFGQVILMGFFQNACQNLTIVLRYFDADDLFYGLKIINNLIVIIYISILICSGSRNTKDIEKNKKKYSYTNLKKRSIIILLFTFPIKFITDMIVLYNGLIYGFTTAKMVLLTIPDFIVSYGKFSIIGFYLLIISLRKQKKQQLKVFIFLIVYNLIIMLTGRRSENVAYICIYLYLFFADKKLDIKNIIILLISAFLGFTFLNALVYNRSYSIGIVNAFNYTLLNKNILFEALREYGNTVYTALSVIIKWLPMHDPGYGVSYYKGISAIFPNLGGIMGDLTRESNFGFILQNSNVLYKQYTNIGGSILGEIIFNFGLYGSIIGAIIIGVIVGNISKKAQTILENECNYNVIYYCTVMSGILYWMRDYFSGISREIVWGLIFCWIIKKIKVKNEEMEN